MKIVTTEQWDEALWRQAYRIYDESFPKEGRKPESIIRRMFDKRMCELHVAFDGETAAAMALTGTMPRDRVLLIDYLAVAAAKRGRGVGRELLDYMCEWARTAKKLDGIVIEIEADPTETNRRRSRFWERYGFTPADYVHRYIWVPEPYRALSLPLRPDAALPSDGESLFRIITRFHEKAYRGR
ncbi:GNAT family N-acetyltransferase [Paenibacillus flagellatus]|nr:GNAT family N-acetyltransferase [Paenibacillus flagellatus]